MKLRSIILGLFTLSISTMCAQSTREKQDGQRNNMSEPRSYGGRMMDRDRTPMDMEEQESLNGTIMVTAPNNQRYNLKIVDGALKTEPKTVKRFAESLRKAQPGDSFIFDLPNGGRLEMVRTETGWAPGNNGGEPVDMNIGVGVLWLICALLLGALIYS